MSILQLGGEELYRDGKKPAKAPSAIVMAADLNRYREIEVFGCTWIDGDGMYAVFDRIVTSDIRVNWMLFMAP